MVAENYQLTELDVPPYFKDSLEVERMPVVDGGLGGDPDVHGIHLSEFTKRTQTRAGAGGLLTTPSASRSNCGPGRHPRRVP